jgi:hypothetical protein
MNKKKNPNKNPIDANNIGLLYIGNPFEDFCKIGL